MFGTNYLEKSQHAIRDISKKLYGIEQLLDGNLYQMKKIIGTDGKYPEIKEVYSAVQTMRGDARIKFGKQDYKKASEGLEEVAEGVSILESSAPKLEKYRKSTLNTVKSYVNTLDKAVKEPENAKSYMQEFVLKHAQKKNVFTNKIVKNAYNRSKPEDKIKILKAYTKGILDAAAMKMFNITDADATEMIKNSLLKVRGYNTYYIK